MSNEENSTYGETVSRTRSEPPTAETSLPANTTKVETYELSTTAEEESISAKAKEAGRSLKNLVFALGKKAKDVTEEKTRELADKSVNMSATTDARDIQALGTNIEQLITVFEDTMAEIRKEPYDEQEKLLVGYKKLLEEQINVINARMNLAKRLKPGA